MPIEDLDLSARTYNALRRFGVTKTGPILGKTEDELLDIPKFGKKSLQELLGKLAAKGIVAAPPEIEEPTAEEAEEAAEPGEPEEAEAEAEPVEPEQGAPKEEEAIEVVTEAAAEPPEDKASGVKGKKRSTARRAPATNAQ